MRRSASVLLLALAMTAGCGKKSSLTVAEGSRLPVRPETSPAQPTPDQLLDPGTQARPQRFNDLVTRSQELRADRFDMPPPG